MEPIYIDDENKPPHNGTRLILSTHLSGLDFSLPGYYEDGHYIKFNGDRIAGHVYAYILFPQPAVYLGSIND